MKLTRNFALVEFGCRDGTPVPPELVDNVRRLAEQLQKLRDFVRKPVRVISGYRTPAWNEARGAERSRHLTAEAADIRVAGWSPKQVHDAILDLIRVGGMQQGGLGLYLPRAATDKRRARLVGWVHYDCDGTGRRRRWRG